MSLYERKVPVTLTLQQALLVEEVLFKVAAHATHAEALGLKPTKTTMNLARRALTKTRRAIAKRNAGMNAKLKGKYGHPRVQSETLSEVDLPLEGL